jgi:hypothetical protein
VSNYEESSQQQEPVQSADAHGLARAEQPDLDDIHDHGAQALAAQIGGYSLMPAGNCVTLGDQRGNDRAPFSGPLARPLRHGKRQLSECPFGFLLRQPALPGWGCRYPGPVMLMIPMG